MEYLGIDLGTTNSLCCVWQDGRSVLIPNVLGEYLTPSAVGIDENGSVLVGALARERLVTHPETTTHNFKRLMGTGVLTNLGSRDFLPEELSAFVLRRLREDAERYLGRTIDEAVISVPAYFNDDQRYATKAAAQLAGLHVQRLVNEPSAAALAYRQDMDEEDSRFLVFDFGGGTLDVSLVDCFDNVVEIVAVAGDNQLGGIDLDLLLAEHFCRETGLDLAALPSAAKAALIRTAESCKQALSRQEHTVMSLQFGQQCYTLPLDQQMLAKVSIPWLERCVAPVERVLRDADETMDSMDAILLVGGSCNMPLVQRYLRYRCAKPVHVSRHPDTLVAHGTGVFAGIKGRKEDLREVMLTDVCPFTLGVDVLSGEETVIFPMIERNSVLPSSIQHRFATAHSFQTQLDVSVYQGEDRYPHNNLYLGKVVVHVPPAPIGEQSVLVRFTYDINGILMVDVTHEESGKTQSLTLLGKRVQFTEEEWAAKCRELEALKLHPLEQEENRHLLAWGERLYQETVGALRANLGQMLEWLNQEFHSQDQHRIGRAKRSARKLFQSVEEQQFTFGEIDFEQLFYGEGE